MKKGVRILQCSDTNMWYKDKIGETYEFLFIDDFDNAIVVDMANSRGDRGSVLPEDLELFEVEDDVSIREFLEIPTEIDILNKKLIDKDEELLEVKLAFIENAESKDQEMLELKLAIAELVEGGI